MAVEMTLPYRPAAASRPASMEEHFRVSQFLTTEAALLDDRRFADWFELLADDIRYYAPTRYNRLARERHKEWGGPRDAAHFDDNKMFLGVRVKRLSKDGAWSEDPPSRTRRLISNMRVNIDQDGHIEADCNFIVYRARAEDEEEWFVGTRHDRLRNADSPLGFVIAERVILFDQTRILANNLGLFF